MISLLTIIALGLLLGMRHATDPDHVIAVSTIVTREHNIKRSALIGAAWGLGHTLTILAVGGAIILFRIALPPRLGLAMEMAVGLMLIILGLKNIRAIFTWSADRALASQATQAHAPLNEELPRYHSHGDYIHVHASHSHASHRNPVAAMDKWFRRYGLYQLLRPLIIGVIHGMAGSAAIALLVLSTISNFSWALAYLVVFGIGTIAGMMLITLTLGSTLAYGQKRSVRLGQHFGVAAGFISLAFGLFIAYQIGFVNGLFTSHPNWIPR